MIAVLSFMPHADGATMIGISLSNSCKLSDNCTTIKELVKEYDNTNQYLSGEFVSDGHGDLKRDAPRLKGDHWNIYKYTSQLLLVVDPDARWAQQMKSNIIIEPSNFVYFNPNDLVMKLNQTTKTTTFCKVYISGRCHSAIDVPLLEKQGFSRIERHNQFINKNCNHAITTAEHLADTINYILSNCTSTELDKSKIVVDTPLIPLNPDDLTFYKYTKWLNKAIKECKQKC